MKFYVNRILRNHRGEHLLDGKSLQDSVPTTLGVVSVEALLRELPQDNNAPGNTKIARWKLAKLIQKNVTDLKPGTGLDNAVKKMDQGYYILLSTEDVNLIKTRIQQGFPAVVVGPAEEAIENDELTEQVEKAIPIGKKKS